MTQELVLGVLLTGLVGLIWIVILATMDRRASVDDSEQAGILRK